jgi:hypothetical protein
LVSYVTAQIVWQLSIFPPGLCPKEKKKEHRNEKGHDTNLKITAPAFELKEIFNLDFLVWRTFAFELWARV